MRRAARCCLAWAAIAAGGSLRGATRRRLGSRRESYAVLLYGHHGHTAGAMVLGAVLRRADPGRARTALVANISDAARASLGGGGLWDLVESDSFRRYGVDTEATDYASVWPGRKLDLWALPYDTVVYMDLDIMLLESATLRAHLDGLFRSELAAPGGGGPGSVVALKSRGDCLNSGTMVLRPHAATFEALEATLNDAGRWKASCPGHDQKVLNAVFDGRWAPLERWNYVKVTEHSCGRIPETPDALHFFADSAPWTLECRACAAAGKLCSRRRHVDASHEGISDCMLPRMRNAQRAWWAECAALDGCGAGVVRAPGAVC